MLFEVEGFQPLEVAAQPVRVVGAHAVRADLCGVSEVVEVLNLPHPDFKTRVLDFADKFPCLSCGNCRAPPARPPHASQWK